MRQAPIVPYFVDFLCRERNLIVEIDGATHGTCDELATDQSREALLKELGFRIFRASNTDIYANLDGVLEALLCYVEDGSD